LTKHQTHLLPQQADVKPTLARGMLTKRQLTCSGAS
jgi:hypothetical protein